MGKYLIFLIISFNLYSGEIQFNRDIRPILSDKCFACHGPSKDRKADLGLDTFENATDSSRKGGAALVAGNPSKSLLYQRLITKDHDERMPPPEHHKHLKQKEIALIKDWIIQGAKYEKHWSFMPIKSAPKLKHHFIDHFVSVKHQQEGLSFSHAADKRNLLRRLALDLTGLPPTQEEIKTFLNNPSSESYNKFIDHYLNSDRYGEHMAKTWLDLVRYGDTHGIHGDNYREMFLYRDWVIKAYQNNMPFDQFAIEQIAGDLLDKPSTDQLIASGFNRLHISNSAGSALKEELYVNNVSDRVNSFGTVFMGLTLGCAACHDHKYDPITQKEYYQLFAYFNNMDGAPDNKGVKSPEPALKFPTEKQKKDLTRLKDLLAKSESKEDSNQLKKKIKKVEQSIESTMIMKENSMIKPAYILNRGQYDQKGELVTRKTPSILPAFKKNLPNNRLGLAKWITDKDHPLLARLTANRLWQQFFGVGLFKTSEDLGSQGEWPTHPELVDALASTLIQSNWNIKSFIKLMVTSRTYQQSSHSSIQQYKTDPSNRWLTRGPRFRMDAEVLRDQALFISGILNETQFGPSIKVPQPKGLWSSVALKESNTGKFTADKGKDIFRRSIYTFWKRSFPPPAMTIFNAPSREVCVSRRERTNTPLQALVLMNEEQFFKTSQTLGSLTHQYKGTNLEKITWLYEKVTCLIPDTHEKQLILKTYQTYLKEHDHEHAWTMIANSLLNLDITKSKG